MRIAAFFISVMMLLAMAGGCRRVENVVYSEFQNIPKTGWDPIHVYGFAPWPLDSVTTDASRYTMSVSIRYSSQRNMPPLTLIVRQLDDEGAEHADTMRLRLDPPASGPTGKGAYGIYERIDTIARNIRLTPGYFVELQSLSPEDQTAGITEIGVTLYDESLPAENSFETLRNRLHL